MELITKEDMVIALDKLDKLIEQLQDQELDEETSIELLKESIELTKACSEHLELLES